MEELFKERLDTVFTRRGITTHRRIRRLLQKHNVSINGNRILESGFRINLESDKIFIDGKQKILAPDIFLMMNKCRGTICSTKDSGLYRTVYSLIPESYFEYARKNSLQKIHTVGRLDTDTEGLLIFTTNGDFSHSLAAPNFHVKKTYFVQLEIPETKERQQEFIKNFSAGILVPPEKNEKEFFSKPSVIKWNSPDSCFLTITEGKFHQIKRMFAAMGNKVAFLKRTAIGELQLDKTLLPGQLREISQNELPLLFKSEGTTPKKNSELQFPGE
ncbi:pseudouridine synthase [Treponema sp.]|uniref:pseudouridine synthase n=1 Tax=Treponema sp. TaxID=166 RepID=UPI003EFF9691